MAPTSQALVTGALDGGVRFDRACAVAGSQGIISSMSEVDPEDESLDRWVVQRHRFDATSRERRSVDEIAFDNETEFLSSSARLSGLSRSKFPAALTGSGRPRSAMASDLLGGQCPRDPRVAH
jgi:hypothetical protein